MHKIISAKPSPYARKVRVAMQEKGIPFELVMEVPWDSTTQTPQYNPLEKLPILVLPDGRPENAVYESNLILEYLETKHPTPSLVPAHVDDLFAAKQIEVVSNGICDAMVLYFFESLRGEDKQSPEWSDRQLRKVQGGIKWLADKVQKSGADGDKTFLVGDSFGLADIAAGSCLGYSNVRFAEIVPWKKMYPHLATYWANLEKRQSFQDSQPAPQSFNDKIV